MVDHDWTHNLYTTLNRITTMHLSYIDNVFDRFELVLHLNFTLLMCLNHMKAYVLDAHDRHDIHNISVELDMM